MAMVPRKQFLLGQLLSPSCGLMIFFSKYRRPLNLDFFEKSLDYLFSLPEVKSDLGAIVVGTSKGGEIAMLMSAFLQDKISAVISINGLCNVLMNDVTYKGKQVLKGNFCTLIGSAFAVHSL